MSAPFQKGDRVVVIGRDGVPDRVGTVACQWNVSVWVDFDDKSQTSTWWWEGTVRPIAPEASPVQSGPKRKPSVNPVGQVSLFDEVFV